MVISTEASPAISMTSDFRMRHLHPYRRRQPVAHGAEPARRHPPVGLFELEELCGPHLVLADLGRDVDILVPGQRMETLDRVLRHDHVLARLVAQALACPPWVPAFDLLHQCCSAFCRAHARALPHPDHISRTWRSCRRLEYRPDILVDRGGIDVDMDLAEPGENASSAVMRRRTWRRY